MTSIEWTDRTWNPVTGCTKVSPGCDHCYAEGIARRFAGSKAFPNGFDVTLHPERLNAPLRWRKPARVFVNSMSDLFHDDISDAFIARVFAVMAMAPQHTFQLLTKRHGRMRSLLNREAWRDEMALYVDELIGDGETPHHIGHVEIRGGWWPLRNVWLGVSVEDGARARLRIQALRETPAAVRFLSCEPLLGPIDLRPWMVFPGFTPPPELPGIDWVIVGGESGPGARRLDVEWVRSLVEQCESAGVPAFVKQLGSAYGPGKGGDIETFPADLRVRRFPIPTTAAPTAQTGAPA